MCVKMYLILNIKEGFYTVICIVFEFSIFFVVVLIMTSFSRRLFSYLILLLKKPYGFIIWTIWTKDYNMKKM